MRCAPLHWKKGCQDFTGGVVPTLLGMIPYAGAREGETRRGERWGRGGNIIKRWIGKRKKS